VLTLSRKRRGLSIPLVLPALLVGLWSGGASAHSFVRSTDPKAGSTVEEAPTAVHIRFDEPVELTFGGIEVLGPDGNQVQVGEAEYASEDQTAIQIGLGSELANGRYTVEWKIVAADGHPREGQFRFRLDQPAPESPASPTPSESPEETHASPEAEMGGAPPSSGGDGSEGAGSLPSVLLGITRWVLFASLLLLVGMGVFALAVWRPASNGARPPEVDDAFYGRWRPIVTWAWGGAVVASLASLVFEGAVAADVSLEEALSGEVLGALLGTRFGLVTVARLALLVVVGAVLLGARAGRARRVLVFAEPRRSVGAAAAAAPLPWGSLSAWAILGLGLLATIGLTGHAGTTSPVVLGMTADLAHLAGAAVWLAGLVGLVVVALPSTRGLADGQRVTMLAPVVTRFSNLAVWCVAVMVASGVVRAWMEIRTLAGLTGYAYGITLLVKLGVVIPLVTMGAINNRWAKPRIRRAAQDASLTPSGASGIRTLNKLVTFEVALAAIVLVITSVLVSLPPPVDAMEGGH
jgi:copper transport protein